MADIGVLPTKTSVQITSTTGEKGTLPAATPRAAGCMSAAQAGQLDTLWGLHQSGDGVGTVVIERPTPDAASRRDLAALAASVERLRAVVSAQPAQIATPLLPMDDGLAGRVALIEQQIPDYDTRLTALSDAVSDVLDHFERMSIEMTARLDDHEKYIPARLELVKGDTA